MPVHYKKLKTPKQAIANLLKAKDIPHYLLKVRKYENYKISTSRGSSCPVATYLKDETGAPTYVQTGIIRFFPPESDPNNFLQTGLKIRTPQRIKKAIWKLDSN